MPSKPHLSRLDRQSIDRRQFVQRAASAAVATAALPTLLNSSVKAAPTRDSKAESAIRELHAGLTDQQRKIVALPLDDPKRKRISANWSITQASVDSFTKAQQELIDRVVRNITSEDGYDRFIKQMKDDSGGIGQYAIALFGDPEQETFEFEMTGRHLTMRADGNTVRGPAFGGPIVYGHGEAGNSPDNLFFYQTLQVNKVFEMLDGKQRERALLEKAPSETAVQLKGPDATRPGIAGKDLSDDQKQLVEETIKAILRPYRQEDVDEAMEVIKAGGGIDAVCVSFYQNGDLADDKIWDVWRLESPTMVCHFRGAPHVHAYINIAKT